MKTMQIFEPAMFCPTGLCSISRRYPTNAEFVNLLELPKDMLRVS